MAKGAHKAGLWLLGALVFAGCYNPSIVDGGFLCAEAGKLCPDGFHCDPTDHKCHSGGSMSGGDGGLMCTIPMVAPLCDDTPATGQLCNPACQVGCACGRCNVGPSGDAVCTTAGAKTLGQVCTLGNGDDCAPGLICLQEVCGNLLGRCYRHCDDASQCTSGGICQVPIKNASGASTSFRACDLAPQTCDPVNNTGCPSPALNCYLTNANDTLCDCPNSPTRPGGVGDACTFYNDCAPGLICISTGAMPHCQPVCNVKAAVCPSGTTCMTAASSATYGYCAQ